MAVNIVQQEDVMEQFVQCAKSYTQKGKLQKKLKKPRSKLLFLGADDYFILFESRTINFFCIIRKRIIIFVHF